MTPVFDAATRLVAWFDGQYVFDLDLEWIAFHDKGDLFASRIGGWLGPLLEGAFLDRSGKPVAWLAGSAPSGGVRPSPQLNAKRPLPPKRPLRPRTPLPPLRPLVPAGGWSSLSWDEWRGNAPSQDVPAVAPDVSVVRMEPVVDTNLADFFGYLDDHLADNGQGGRYFQPLPKSESSFPLDKQLSFCNGLAVPVGEHGWRRAWIARGAGDTIVGHVDLRGHPERFAAHRCLLGMGVHRDRRRLGLGSTLLAHAEQWAGATGTLRWIDLRVLSSNDAAVALYRRAGFQMTGGTPDMFVIDGVSFGEVSMSKRLSPST
jgi:ribosomal protein S18 acetylase RimI-like enzyme